MNKIERKFYNAFMAHEDDTKDMCELMPQYGIGIFRVDFVYGHIAIEIDGHEYHKTKEQRFKDAKKDRYLISEGFVPVRFTASEVYVDADSCIGEMLSLNRVVEFSQIDSFLKGCEIGERRSRLDQNPPENSKQSSI